MDREGQRVRLYAREPRPSGEELRRDPSSFHVLVLGDFSGRGLDTSTSEAPPLEERAPLAVDRDDFDDVLRRIGPELRIELATGERERTLPVGFEGLQDFHPDRLLRLPALDELTSHYTRLADDGVSGPSGRTSGEPRFPSQEDATGRSDESASTAPPSTEDEDGEPGRDDGLLDRVVAETDDGSAGPGPRGTGREEAPPDDQAFSEYLRELVRPHLVEASGADPDRRALRDRLQELLADGLRSLLHHPDIQAVESSWRGLRFLVDRVESGSDVRIHLVDVTKAELSRDLERRADGGESRLVGRLVEDRAGTPGAEPWSVLVGLYGFGPAGVDLLRRLGGLARAAGAPFLAAARPSLAGLPSFEGRPDRSDWRDPGGGEADAWRGLRSSDVARWLGLGLPRFLLRLPYGPDHAPCGTLPFREVGSPPRHEAYLWGNPALLLAVLLARSWARDRREMRPGSHREVSRLPLHLYPADGGTRAKPCAEMLMPDSVASELMDRGFIPLASVKERGTVRVTRFQSVARPPAGLAGRWG